MNIIYAPNEIPADPNTLKVFLAGSIEMGRAEDWQARVTKLLENEKVMLINPRRLDWDMSWKQDPTTGPFRTQVWWEQNGIDLADIVLFYFSPGTISPISLLELGLVLGSKINGSAIVSCPKEFHRYGNVAITCEYYGTKCHETLEDAVESLRITINLHNLREAKTVERANP